jgi:hypothetical protein
VTDTEPVHATSDDSAGKLRVSLLLTTAAWDDLRRLAGGDRMVGRWLSAHAADLGRWQASDATLSDMRRALSRVLRNPYSGE